MLKLTLLIFAVVLASPAMAQNNTATASTDIAKADWAAEIEPMGWTFLGFSPEDDLAYFVKAAPSTGHYRRMWDREELRTADGEGVLSMVALSDVDCSERRSRTIQISSFTNRNMADLKLSDSNLEEWKYPIPQSFADDKVNRACAGYSRTPKKTTRP